MHAPFAAPPEPSERHLCPASTEQALMHGLAKGLEGLLGTKPVPPAPKLACCCGPRHPGATRLVPGARGTTTRTASTEDNSPRGQVVRLPVRARKPILASSVMRLTEPRLIRL